MLLDQGSAVCLSSIPNMRIWIPRFAVAAYLDALVRAAAADLRCGSVRLADGHCLWLYFHVYFSPVLYADRATSQRALLTSFLLHYLKMSIPPSNFLGLIQVNQQHGRLAGKRFVHAMRRDYGIQHMRLVFTGKNTSNRDLEFLGWLLLREYTRDEDWIIKADVDEFHALPGHAGFAPNITFNAHAYFDALNKARLNVVNGFLIDRLTLDASLREVRPSLVADTIAEQFPVLCSLTANWRHSDVRKVVAYKGYIRTPSSHHFAFGIDSSYAPCNITCPCSVGCDSPNKARFPVLGGVSLHGERLEECTNSAKHWYNTLRKKLGKEAFDLMPFKGRGQLPILRPAPAFASSFHFKWHSGLWWLQRDASSFGGHRLPRQFAKQEFLSFVASHCHPARLHGDTALTSREIAAVFNYRDGAGQVPGGWWGILAHMQANYYCNGLYNMRNLRELQWPL